MRQVHRPYTAPASRPRGGPVPSPRGPEKGPVRLILTMDSTEACNARRDVAYRWWHGKFRSQIQVSPDNDGRTQGGDRRGAPAQQDHP